MVKLLKISAEGLMLFKDKVDIDFYTEQRVLADNNEMVFNPFGKIYTNNVLSIVGINASGKTSLLKLISFITRLVNGAPINNIDSRDILVGSDNVFIESIFYNDQVGVCKLVTNIRKEVINELESRYIIAEEKLFIKNTKKIKTRRDILEFTKNDLYKERDNSAEFLQDDASIAISLSKLSKIYVDDLISTTNRNYLQLIGDFPHELIAFLDPSIEKIEFNKKNGEAALKFYGKETIKVSNPMLFENYLSSGTIKGINVFISAMVVFSEGGYLLVDELENHFNREIVATLIRFFMNKRVNPNGGTLIFSTHYSELLDEFDRNDSIFIVRNRGGISIQKLSNILKRNDIKKSEAFKSDFLDGTVPSYESYINLKRAIINNPISEG
ncbi:hypothetical protein SAMN02910384_01244 [Pseudobutyrivibrio sp. ACV-2]|uniref:AAA family ATPase n=1 Tax=Pseudobutyrivibrio sp. ACV-2 TaxID=1520801 RepID=UPI0008954215|nr:AAA family ATPase [Pseudobutyrivibrio sp. ACV-2]SEA30120.1 hypothetical protein SAMN02910384_01244 [Pseudobutyrivibrio sp. ACV-2]